MMSVHKLLRNLEPMVMEYYPANFHIKMVSHSNVLEGALTPPPHPPPVIQESSMIAFDSLSNSVA